MTLDLTKDRIFVAGHTGLVGSALCRALQELGCTNLIVRSRQELDLTDQQSVRRFFAEQSIDVVFMAAGKVGGILANSRYGGDFIRDNLLMQSNVIDSAHRGGARKLLFLGSSCMYPKAALQPMQEADLLSGPLEPTNEAYAVAKLAGMAMCQAYRRQFGFDAITAIPANLYGPGDRFDPEDSHFVPGLIRRFHDAKAAAAETVSVWGSGTPRREMMHAADCARACIRVLERYASEEPINLGTGTDHSIAEIAAMIKEIVGFEGELRFDTGRPDGAPRKLLDISGLEALGWVATMPPRDGLLDTYRWFLENELQ